MKNETKKFTVVRSFRVAFALEFLTKQKAYKYKNKNYKEGEDSIEYKYVYSFISDDKFKKAYKELMNLRDCLEDDYKD